MTDRLIGIMLGKYQVIERIGQGGMGTVYKGRQLSLNRAVAIKMLPAQMAADEDFVQRFRQEAEVIAGLAHENIVYVYDIDQFEDTYFIVMEFIDGYSLRQLRAGQPMRPEEVRAVGISVARALQYAHERGIIHRDIKSANVMVTREGKVKLMDFGIAKAAGSGIKTVTGSVLGTPEYMAPEQARTGRTSPQSDVYSLGVMLYELATGGLPFAAEDPFAIALKHVSEEPEPPQARVPSIPDWLNQIILHAMAKDLGQRYATAAEMEHDLLAAGGAGVTGTLQALSGVAPVEPTQPMSTPPPPLPSTPVPLPPGQTPYPSPTFTESATLPAQTPPPPIPGSGPYATPPAVGGRPTPPPRQASYTPTPQPPYTPTPQPPYTPTPQPPYTPTPQPPQGAMPVTPYQHQGAPLAGTVVATEAPTMPPSARGRSVPLWAVVAGGIAIVALLVVAAMLAFGPAEPPALEVEAQVPPTSDPGAPRAASATSTRESEGRSVVLTEEQKRQIEQELEAEPDQEPRPPESSEPAGAREPGAMPQPTEPRPAPGPATTQPPRPEPKPSATRPLPVTETPPAAVQPAPSRRAAGELWMEADRLKSSHSYHSLQAKLDELLAIDPYHEQARNWRDKCPGWIREHEEDLTEEVNDRLEELVDGIDDQDLEDVLELWGKRADGATERFFADLFGRYKVCKARFTLQSLKIHDGAANFTARMVIEAKSEKGRNVPFETVLQRDWNGQVFDDGDRKRFSRSFP